MMLRQYFLRFSNYKKVPVRIVRIVVLAILILIALSSFIVSALNYRSTVNGNWATWWDGTLQNFSTEIIGALLTFILVDIVIGAFVDKESRAKAKAEQAQAKARKQAELEEKKGLLILDLLSTDPVVANKALAQVCQMNWLSSHPEQDEYSAEIGGTTRTVSLRDIQTWIPNLKGKALRGAQVAALYFLSGGQIIIDEDPDGNPIDPKLGIASLRNYGCRCEPSRLMLLDSASLTWNMDDLEYPEPDSTSETPISE